MKRCTQAIYASIPREAHECSELNTHHQDCLRAHYKHASRHSAKYKSTRLSELICFVPITLKRSAIMGTVGSKGTAYTVPCVFKLFLWSIHDKYHYYPLDINSRLI